MKTKTKILSSLLLLTLFITLSCGSKRVVSTPNEVKMMTTKQYDVEYNVIFKSVMSLLQSEQFSIESTDMQSGLIVATRNIYEKKKATLNKSVVIVDKLNDKLTEVKITVYSGKEKISNSGYSTKKKKVENMIQDPIYYNKWFNKLFAEIARRKALM